LEEGYAFRTANYRRKEIFAAILSAPYVKRLPMNFAVAERISISLATDMACFNKL
jgi:hypothetical protein